MKPDEIRALANNKNPKINSSEESDLGFTLFGELAAQLAELNITLKDVINGEARVVNRPYDIGPGEV